MHLHSWHLVRALCTRWCGQHFRPTLACSDPKTILYDQKPCPEKFQQYLVVVVFPSIFWLSQIFTVPSFEQVAKIECSSDTRILFTADLCSWRCATKSPLGCQPRQIVEITHFSCNELQSYSAFILTLAQHYEHYMWIMPFNITSDTWLIKVIQYMKTNFTLKSKI